MGDVISFPVKVVPRASSTVFRGRMADGTCRIALKSPPVDGKANRELIRFLANEFEVPASAVQIVRGRSSRRKTVRICSSPVPPQWYRE